MHERTIELPTAARTGQRGVALTVLAVVLAALGVALGFVGLVVATGDSDTTGVAAAGEPQTVEVSLTEFAVTPASLQVTPGTEVTLVVTNDGTMPHDLKLNDEQGTGMLDAGASETIELGAIEETSELWCTVPGHREAGMSMTIEATGAAGEVAAGGHTGPSAAPAVPGDFAVIDFSAEPAEGWTARDPRLQPAPGATEHAVELHATEEVIEVAPGVTQMLWTFNGEVPGPVLRGKVGDVFTIELFNDGEVGHSIDFHASQVAWNDEMRTIQPGESLTYQFRATSSGVFMYHCGTAPTLHHIGNGMFGAIVIDPPDLAPVDHEFFMVQSELYLGPEGGVGDLSKMQTEAEDAIVFNGYVNQYFHEPIHVEVGERVRVFVLDAGPSENSSFHIVGTIFDTMYKEGAYTLRPDQGLSGGAQALDLQPAQGGFVEFSLAEDGLYPMVTHKFSNVGKGAMGIFQAGTGGTPVAGGH